VGDPQSAPPINTKNVEIVFKSTTGKVTYKPTTQTNGRQYINTKSKFQALQICQILTTSKSKI